MNGNIRLPNLKMNLATGKSVAMEKKTNWEYSLCQAWRFNIRLVGYYQFVSRAYRK
jgi:hypothetical protein